MSTIVDLLRWQALHRGKSLAYTFLVDGEAEKKELTYGELDQQSRAIGASLQLAGATGERVLLLCPPGLDFIAAFLGCLYAGAVAVPSYPPQLGAQPGGWRQRLSGIIEDTQSAVALTTKAALNGVTQVFSESPGAKNMRLFTVDDIAMESAEEWREPAINGNTLAMLQYTSGSTSAPKGVMVSHGNLLSNERMIQNVTSQTEESIFVGWLPLYHDMGLIGIMLHSLFLGARSVLMPPTAFLQKPSRWLQAISNYRATLSGGPNFAYDLCARKVSPEDRAQLDLSSWGVAFNGAEPIFHETLKRFATTFESCGFRPEAFYPCYGLAEGTLIVSGGLKENAPVVKSFQAAALESNRAIPADYGQQGSRHLVGCGNNLSGERIAIVHPESLTECAQGEIGEVWVAGPNVAQGYWRHSQETECTFRAYLPATDEGPFLRTGDLGFMWESELFVTGRLKDLIIIDGRNHYPQDIELTVGTCHPAIRPGCCAAFSTDFEGRERLVVAAELDSHFQNPNHDEVIKTIRQAVVEKHDLRVERIWFLKAGALPKTSSGKIQRRTCRANFLSTIIDK